MHIKSRHKRTNKNIKILIFYLNYFLRIDDSSIQITNFLRGYVDNEINLNVHKSCDKSCPEYRTARQHGCYEGTFCDYQRKAGRKDTTCTGQIFDCTFVEADMTICLSVSAAVLCHH